jgi:hypothetical protein
MVEIKARLEARHFTTDQSAATRERLAQCLSNDLQHITPKSQRGAHIAAIQTALQKIGEDQKDLGLPPITDAEGEYGSTTADAVLKYKSKPVRPIARSGQPIDNVVGRMTISEMDRDLLKIEKTKPKPGPSPPNPPISGMAGLHVANTRGKEIILEYYKNCGLETIGPGQVETLEPIIYSTFEDLLVNMAKSPGFNQVIVNHGEKIFGLLIKICPETTEREVGKVIGQFAALAEMAEAGPITNETPLAKTLIEDCQNVLHVNRAVVLRIIDKLVQVRRKPSIIHFRACNMPSDIVADYKRAFKAIMVTFHRVRLIFIRVGLQEIPAGQLKVASRAKALIPSAVARFRLLEDPIGLLEDALVTALDVDGGPTVNPFTFIDKRSTAQIKGWAEFLVRRWKQSEPQHFVVPIMWKNSETTFSFPLEETWRTKLEVI